MEQNGTDFSEHEAGHPRRGGPVYGRHHRITFSCKALQMGSPQGLATDVEVSESTASPMAGDCRLPNRRFGCWSMMLAL